MGYFNYSPWQDAASYGKGLGQTLAAALIQRPQQQEDLREQKAKFPLEQELTSAKIQEALATPELRKMMMQASMQRNENTKEYQQGELGVRKEQVDTTKQYDEGRIQNDQTRNKIAQQRATTADEVQSNRAALDAIIGALDTKKMNTMGQPKPGQQDAQMTRAMQAEKLLGASLPGGDKNTQLSAGAAESAINQEKEDPTSSIIGNLLKMLQPQLQTNKTWMGFGPENVTTNGAKFQVPVGRNQPNEPVSVQHQPMANAPAPWTPPPATVVPNAPTAVNPKTGQRVQFVNGQWIPLQ